MLWIKFNSNEVPVDGEYIARMNPEGRVDNPQYAKLVIRNGHCSIDPGIITHYMADSGICAGSLAPGALTVAVSCPGCQSISIYATTIDAVVCGLQCACGTTIIYPAPSHKNDIGHDLVLEMLDTLSRDENVSEVFSDAAKTHWVDNNE